MRVARVLRHRAQAATDADEEPSVASLLLLQCASTAPSSRVVVEGSTKPGDRAGKRPVPGRRKHLCVRSPEGLELHADVHVKASDRAGLERLCRYIARPPICADRLHQLPDGRIEFRLKRTWKGGVRSLIFAPLDLIARLAALIPLPRTHMRRFYGVFGPAHPLRSRVVPPPPCADRTEQPVAPKRPARMTWSDLLKRTFEIDALRCPRCSGPLRLITAVLEPTAIQAILAAIHLADAQIHEERARTTARGPPGPARRSVA